MKATFVHDFPVFLKGEETYSYGGFQSPFWKRYMVYIKELNVICRVKKNPEIKLEESHRIVWPNVNINPVDNYSGIKDLDKRKKAFKTMEDSIKNSDFVILRLPSILAIDAYKIIKKHNKPYVVEVVGSGYDAFFHNGKILGKIIAPVIDKKMKNIVYSANSAIYVTKDYLQKKYLNPNETVAISNAEIMMGDKGFTNKKGRLKDKNKLTIGFLGAVNVKYKNFYHGLKYLQKYSEHYDIHIDLVIGGGGRSKQIEKQTSLSERVNVKNIGRLKNRNAVNEWFESLDLFIHPSITEGLPRVVMEAMNNKTPVIASSAGGTSELLPNDFIFNPKSYESFEEAMTSISNTDIDEIINKNTITIAEYEKEKLQRKRDTFFSNFISKEFER